MTSKILSRLRAASCLIIPLLLISCTRPEPTGNNVICLVDLSDSGKTLERKEFYMNVIRDVIIPNLGVYDAITVIPIDDASVTNSAEIIRKDFSEINFEPEVASPMNIDRIIEENLKKTSMVLSAEFETLYRQALQNRSSYGSATDIFGAMEQAEKMLDINDTNIIIFLSDMMNYTDALKMEPGNSGFNKNSIDDALNRVPNYDFSGTKTLVLTGEMSDISTSHFNLVKSFWTSYFQRNGMTLYDYSSTSTAKLNELLESQEE